MFELHERLAADTAMVTDWPLCRVLLMNDQTYPWLILVPRRKDAVELHDLCRSDRAELMEEVAKAGDALKSLTGADKINVGALGNVVPQLHVHVIGRFRSDAVWPRPVWGAMPAQPYSSLELQMSLRELRAVLS